MNNLTHKPFKTIEQSQVNCAVLLFNDVVIHLQDVFQLLI